MFWRRSKTSRSPGNSTRLNRSAFRPGLEALEARELLAAQPLLFTLDSTLSTLALSGHVTTSLTGGTQYSIQAQGTGALSSRYSGTINTNWDPSPARIQFVQAGTAADATVTGNWAPAVGGVAGNAPADYGAHVNISLLFPIAQADVAVRNFVAAMSTAGFVNITGTSFPSNQTLTITGGTADYRVTGLATANGTASLVNAPAINTAGNGTFQDLGNGQYRLTTPVSLTLTEMVASGGLSATVVLNIIGSTVSNAVRPVVDLNGAVAGNDFSTSTVGGGAPVAIAATTATLTRATPANMTGANITLTNRPNGAAESLDANVTGTGLTKAYNSATGVLTISGSATTSVYETVLRSVTYRNTNVNATAGNRTIEVIVRDSLNESQIRTSTVAVAPTIQLFLRDLGGLQHSMVRFFILQYSTPVNVAEGAYSLTKLGAGGGTVGLFALNVDIEGQTYSILLFDESGISGAVYPLAWGIFALNDGNYRLDINASLITSATGGIAVDADGNGTAGGNRVTNFHRYFGDSDGDRDVDDTDAAAFLAAYGSVATDPNYNDSYDLNGDSDVDDDDLFVFLMHYGTSLPA